MSSKQVSGAVDIKRTFILTATNLGWMAGIFAVGIELLFLIDLIYGGDRAVTAISNSFELVNSMPGRFAAATIVITTFPLFWQMEKA